MNQFLALTLSVLLCTFAAAGIAAANPVPPLPEGPIVQLCTDGVGVFASPCPGSICGNIEAPLFAPWCWTIAQ
jgi:hypothetical protein